MGFSTGIGELDFLAKYVSGKFGPGEIVIVGNDKYAIPNVYFNHNESVQQEVKLIKIPSKESVSIKDAIGNREWVIEF